MVSSEESPDGAEQSHDNGLIMSENQEPPPSSGAEKTLQEPGSGVHISQLDKDGSISSITPRALQTHTAGSPSMRTGQEGQTPVGREKGFDDGYHWRKYGQKLVKGNEFVRSYYKCTHPSCQVKKQLERSHGGQIADIVYFGEHVHPKPLNNVPMAVGFVLSVEERRNEHKPIANKDKTANAGKETSQIESTKNSQVSTVTLSDNAKHVQAESNKIRDHVDNDEDQRSKRQKKGNRNVDPTPADKLTGEPRFVVQTMSEVDIVNDGYRWRKYGQKMVKGNPNPRSYYRCSSPGCPAKKHVERASHDQKLIITSYEGRHDHDMPPSRTVTHNATVTALDAEPGAKSGGSEAHDNSTPKSESKTEGSEKAAHSRSGIENKPSEQQNGKSSTAEEKADAGMVNVAITSTVSNDRSSEKQNSAPKTESKSDTGKVNNVITSSASNGRSSEKQNSEIKIEPKDDDNPLGVQKITSPPNSIPNDHHIREPEPVNS